MVLCMYGVFLFGVFFFCMVFGLVFGLVCQSGVFGVLRFFRMVLVYGAVCLWCFVYAVCLMMFFCVWFCVFWCLVLVV